MLLEPAPACPTPSNFFSCVCCSCFPRSTQQCCAELQIDPGSVFCNSCGQMVTPPLARDKKNSSNVRYHSDVHSRWSCYARTKGHSPPTLVLLHALVRPLNETTNTLATLSVPSAPHAAGALQVLDEPLPVRAASPGSRPTRIDTGPGPGPANYTSFLGPSFSAYPSPNPDPGPVASAGTLSAHGVVPLGGDGGPAEMPMMISSTDPPNGGGFEGLNMYGMDLPYIPPSDMAPTAGFRMELGGAGAAGLMMQQQSQQSDDPYGVGDGAPGDPYAGAGSSLLGPPGVDPSLSPAVASEQIATICGMCGEFYPNCKHPSRGGHPRESSGGNWWSFVSSGGGQPCAAGPVPLLPLLPPNSQAGRSLSPYTRMCIFPRAPAADPFCRECGAACRPAETYDLTAQMTKQMASVRVGGDDAASVEPYVADKAWWVSIMTRVESEKLLEDAEPGAFLLRQRVRPALPPSAVLHTCSNNMGLLPIASASRLVNGSRPPRCLLTHFFAGAAG